ncbi:MAG: molecular chaperone GrpE [Stackebrandtia sp.]
MSEDDTVAMARVRRPGSAERLALAELLGIELSAEPSEAEVLQALIEAGRIAVEEKVRQRGYAALAAARDEEDRAYEAAMRARRRGSAGD